MSRRFLPIASLGLGLSLVLLGVPASGLEQTFGYRSSSSNFDGMKGRQGIRTDPSTVNGVGYVHPSQMDIGAEGGDFVAIGTAKGVGVAGTSCDDDYGGLWTVYTDGRIGGVWWCEDLDVNAYGPDTNPTFTIEYGWCPSASANRWLLFFDGTLWRCKAANPTTGSRTIVMLETTGSSTVDRNIDVKYSGLERSAPGAGYVSWGTASQFIAPTYAIDQPTGTQINIYEPPLD